MTASVESAVKVLAEHRAVATGLGVWVCKCSPMEWRPSVLRPRHLAIALREAGLLRDAAP